MREHGTNAKFVIEKCRCQECKDAHYAYERKRRRRKAYGGDYWPWVDAEPVRRHVFSLMTKNGQGCRDGLGPKKIAEISGVPHGAISKLLYGNYRGRPPSKRVRKDTAQKLLAVRREDGPYQPAGPTWQMIEELVGFGFPKRRLALALGKACAVLQLSKNMIHEDNVRAVERLHWSVWLRAPRFRERCSCLPPDGLLEALESASDDAVVAAPSRGWAYPLERLAKATASRVAAGDLPLVVTEEGDGFHWYPGPEFVPKEARVLARKYGGRWIDEADYVATRALAEEPLEVNV